MSQGRSLRSLRQLARASRGAGGNCWGTESRSVGLTSSPFSFRFSWTYLGVRASSSASSGMLGSPFFFRARPSFLLSRISASTLLVGFSYSPRNSDTKRGRSDPRRSAFSSKKAADSGLRYISVDSTFFSLRKLEGRSSLGRKLSLGKGSGESTFDALLQGFSPGELRQERSRGCALRSVPMRLPVSYLRLLSLSSSRMRSLAREGSSPTLTRLLIGEFSVSRFTWQLLARRFGPTQPAHPPIQQQNYSQPPAPNAGRQPPQPSISARM